MVDKLGLFCRNTRVKIVAGCITGLILAGGRSTRFGADKARHPVAGQSMIEHVTEAVAAVTEAVLISVAETPVDRSPAVRYVVDQYAGAGPLAGLHAGLQAAETPWVLAVACDMPFLTVAVLQALLDARTPGAEAVVSRTPDGRGHPLCACYHYTTGARMEAHLRAGTLALHTLLDALASVQYVDLPAGPLRNVNRVSDLDLSGDSHL